jgi:hypothetical protein
MPYPAEIDSVKIKNGAAAPWLKKLKTIKRFLGVFCGF